MIELFSPTRVFSTSHQQHNNTLPKVESFAILIGVNYGMTNWERYDIAEKIELLGHHLVHNCGILCTNVRTLTQFSSTKPTKENIMKTVEEIMNRAINDENRIYLFMLGHGDCFDKTILQLSDGQVLDVNPIASSPQREQNNKKRILFAPMDYHNVSGRRQQQEQMKNLINMDEMIQLILENGTWIQGEGSKLFLFLDTEMIKGYDGLLQYEYNFDDDGSDCINPFLESSTNNTNCCKIYENCAYIDDEKGGGGQLVIITINPGDENRHLIYDWIMDTKDGGGVGKKLLKNCPFSRIHSNRFLNLDLNFFQ